MNGDKEIIRALQRRRYSYSIKNRITYPGAVYHLIQRAPGEEIIFREEADYLHMLSLLKETAARFRWDVFSFVLMPNHVHFLIRISEENLSQGAKFIFQSYALYFNEKYERKGPVFCRPFRAFLCLNDAYLLTISIYIHLNPYKANLAESPYSYRWSSINLFCSERPPKTFVNYKFPLTILNPDLSRAKEIYKELLKDASQLEYQDINKNPFFIRDFYFSFLNLSKTLKNTVFPSTLKKKIRLFNQLKYRKEEKERRRKIIEEMRRKGFKIKDISNYLGCSRQQIYRLLNQ